MYDDPYGGYGAYDSGPDPLVILIGLVAITIGLGIAIGIHWMLYRAFAAIPEEHRQLEPWQVWLNLIPCFNLFWSFVVFVRLPRSFAATSSTGPATTRPTASRRSASPTASARS